MGSFINQPEFATTVEVITPSDTISSATKLGGVALYVGTAGDVKVIIQNKTAAGGGPPDANDAVTFKNVGNGCFLPVICDYVIATGTGATNILSIK
jgi:hypothetical protein|tara:strand:+ start:219 stop:506 length:288 start_codon:yes stop_codon:yes gene_type:complete